MENRNTLDAITLTAN